LRNTKRCINAFFAIAYANITQKKETRRKERNERKEEKRKKNPPVGKRTFL
jgi:hypothetical protein